MPIGIHVGGLVTHQPCPSTCEALGIDDDPLHGVGAIIFLLVLQAQSDLLGRVLEGTGEICRLSC